MTALPDLEADVAIIGAGAGGGALAWGLCHAGIRVLMIEAGPAFVPPRDYPQTAVDWERHAFPQPPGSRGRHRFAPLQPLDEGLRAELGSWNAGQGPLNPRSHRHGWRYHHVRGVGGSTLHFTGEAHRLHPRAFRLQTEFGVGADWPIDYDTLESWYRQAEALIGVAGVTEPSRPRSGPYPQRVHPPGHAAQRLMGRSSLTWHPNALAVLSSPHQGRPACNYCAACNRGCPRTDKGSTDVTFIRQAQATGRLTLLTDTEVLRLVPGGDDRISALVISGADGARRRVRARVNVVACGAVETPRLLLLSANAHAPDGLANESGMVGRNFMETLSWKSTGLHPEPLGSHRGLPADIICWDFNAPDAIPGVVGGCRFTHSTAEGGFNGPIAHATRALAGWGRDHRRRLRAEFGRLISVGAIGESLPHPGSFIDLDPEAKDDHGRPLARIHSHLDDMAVARLRFMARKTREILAEAGVTDLREEYGTWDFFSATHVFGTARMGTDPGTSVVDANGRSHRWKNLYIADASLFPSSGGGESPALTIAALALRMAGHIAEHLRRRD
ncbi:GMC oxidoreductase [Thiohalobacter sp.]|uniref:GMC oxidoreductase n=1 Tax=Thiohalobacter sp. TaxID=2025948 RepID=UPI00263087AD|nr:GMC family oxidoreductase [Thiohalobacter sp.]